ncbi:MAG: efflux RND transporter permease subunit [Nevskia sp.]|nr:efflux RND transporter permease subunit [Nevskia sp.]
MIWFVRVALARPYTFVVMALGILLFGVLAALRTPADILPDIKIPVIAVVWTYAGLPPADMSGRIVYYYERQLSNSVNDIEHVESQSLAGIAVVKIFFQPNVDIRTATAQVTSISQTVLKYLPPGITPPQILNYNASTVPIVQLALSSAKLPEQVLGDLASNLIRPRLTTVQGAAIPSPYGGKVRQVQIDIDSHALQARGLSAQDVETALAAQNQIIPVGTEKIGPFEYSIQLNDSPERIEELNDLPIKAVNGTVILMRDVAHVRDGYPPQINVVHVDGGRSVLMTILKSGATSTLAIIDGVKKLMPRLKEELPENLDLKLVGDQSIFVKAAIAGVAREGVIAAALTSLMILLFLGSWRSTLIIATSIPLAVLGSILGLSALGQTLNIMTLGGLALAVGILVDDATVTIENINWHLEQGKQVTTAILDGAHQIVTPAFVSLLCICIVFVPMFFLGGIAGYLFVPMAEAVMFAMISSFILSRTLVPTMANYILRAHASEGHASGELEYAWEQGNKCAVESRHRNPLVRFQRAFERRFEAVRHGYRDLLELALANPRLFIPSFLAVVLVSFLLIPLLGENFFPTVDAGQLNIHVRAPIGTRLEESAAIFARIEDAIRRAIPPAELDALVDNIGLPVSGINNAYLNTGTIGPQDGDIQVTLKKDHHPTTGYVKTLRERLPREFPGTTFAFLPADIISQILNFGAPAPIDIQVVGTHKEENYAYAYKLLHAVEQVPGVADARIQQSQAEPTFKVDVDRARAQELGITERDVTNSMVVSLAGSVQVAPAFWLNPKNGVSYPIVAQQPQYRLDSLSDLRNLQVTTGDGRFSQILGGLASITRIPSEAVVSHYNIEPLIDIFATPQGRDLGAVAGGIHQVLRDLADQVPKGSLITLRGQVQTMHSSFSGLLFGLLGALVLIYMIIVVNFQSWSDPFVIITALPAALAGIVWMLFATHTTLSVPALTGAIMCMGVGTANSILVVSFARARLAECGDGTVAARDAGFSRFRPVLMTALAMIIGMLPMALGMGEGGEQNAPLGRAVIGGLLFATVATLIFVPVVFSVIHGSKGGAAAPDANGVRHE